MLKKLIILLALLSLTACGTVNNALVEKTKNIEYYRIYDIKTNYDRGVVADAASNGLGKNVGDLNETRPIPNYSTAPNKPGRFKVKNLFENTNLGLLAARGGAGLSLKTATCDGAIWTANATKTVANTSNLNITGCLFEYKDGFQLDLYAHLAKKEGGLFQISRSMAQTMVGTPEEWVEKTFLDTVRKIYADTHANISFVEGYPKQQGTPWLDSGESFAKKQ